MRHQTIFLFALCAAAVYSVGALPSDAFDGKNYASSEHNVPCNNTINGITTDATDVEGNILKGCGNVVSNNTNSTGDPVPVEIYGSDNTVEDNVVASDKGYSSSYGVYVGWESSDSTGSGNIIVGNTADYIAVWESSVNNTIENNVASYIRLQGDTSAVITNNEVDASKIATDSQHGLNSDSSSWPGALWVGYSTNVSVESNTAGYVGASHDVNSVFKKNDASSDYFEYDSSVDVESNQGAPPALCAPPLPPASRAPPALLTPCRPPQPTTISSLQMTWTSPWKTIQ